MAARADRLLLTQQYGRSNSLAAYKTENMEEMAASIIIVDAVVKETESELRSLARPSAPPNELTPFLSRCAGCSARRLLREVWHFPCGAYGCGRVGDEHR